MHREQVVLARTQRRSPGAAHDLCCLRGRRVGDANCSRRPAVPSAGEGVGASAAPHPTTPAGGELMMRLRIALVAAVMAIGAIAVPTAGASNGTTVPTKLSKVPALYTMPVSGVAKNGKRFTGTYGIQRFVARNGHAYAYGTVKGTLKGRHVTRYGVLVLVWLAGATGAQTSPASCPILHLVIAPIDLNLL